ncbi:ABC transporter substrate-binding protein [Sulfurisphaera ohwakuensis]|uniref:ABC transporter substrate-binding protein n=1 Tax=Sulfurisphaera ohwakuensis TaxID=69656 RepID=UPI0036F28201
MKIWGIVLAVVVIIAILAGVIYTYMRANNNNVSTTSSHNLRIISLAPSDTQVLIALGLGKYIVGIDYYSYSLLKYLNLTSQVPANVTVFSQIYPPNISGLLLLHPSIVVVEYGLEAPYISQMEKAGLNVLVTNSDYAYSFSQIEENIMEIAKYFNVTQQGEELINWMNEKIADFSTLGNTTIAYMLYICPNLDFYTAGGNVFINSIIVQGGGINVFSTYSDYPLLSPDELLVSNPQVIIAQEVSNFSYTESLISQIPGIKNVKAFNASRIYILGNLATDLLNEPGPLSVYAILMVHDIINSTAPKYVTASWVKENLNIELPIF